MNVCHFDAGCAAVMMCFDIGHEERGGEEKGRERVRVRGGGGGRGADLIKSSFRQGVMPALVSADTQSFAPNIQCSPPVSCNFRPLLWH